MAKPRIPSTTLFKKGLATRREVLGAEYVDKALQSATDFTMPFQQLVTEWCWGSVWTRPGLDRKTRSMLNIAMITALNRPNELRLHLRGALNNGVSRQQIQEILLQAAIYCGAPAALDGFKIAAEVLSEEEEKKPRRKAKPKKVGKAKR